MLENGRVYNARNGLTEKDFEAEMIQRLHKKMDYWFVDKVTNIGMKCHIDGRYDKVILDKLVVDTRIKRDLNTSASPWFALNYLKRYVGKTFEKSDFHAYTDFALLAEDFDKQEDIEDYKTYLSTHVKPAEGGLYDY